MKICVFVLAFIAVLMMQTGDAARQLSSFDDLSKTLQAGHMVRFTSKYAQCQGDSDPVHATGGDAITTYELFSGPEFGPIPFISFSTSELIQNYQGAGWIYDFVRMRVYQDNSISISVFYLDAKTYEVTLNEGFNCTVNSGDSNDQGGVYFYQIDSPSAHVDVPLIQSTPACIPNELVLFQTFIIGHFSNAQQIADELRNGQQIHPYSEHISDIANQKIDNQPVGGLPGFFVLEESYYTTNGSTIASPFLFYFSATVDGTVEISSYDIPSSIDRSALRNNNTALRFDYNTLTLSKTFNPSVYRYNALFKVFELSSVTIISPTVTFILKETIGAYNLLVMEDTIVNGHSVMPYHTPIAYNRI